MNWKWIIAAVFGVAIGLSIAPFEHKTVLASVAPANAHFQLQSATVDESDSEGQPGTFHDVFLLDTETGNVWEYEGTNYIRDQNKKVETIVPPGFFPVRVQSSK